MRSLVAALALLFIAPLANARPLLTEEVATEGRHNFESGFTLTKRVDEFSDPLSKYTTVNFPVFFKLGLSPRIDAGLGLTQIGQRLEVNGASFSGSANGLVTPQLKYSPWDSLGFQVLWHVGRAEREGQELPVARGDDIETVLLLKAPFEWPLHVNIGYLFRGGYKSNFGVANTQSLLVKPSNIFESKASLEIPIPWHFGLLSELAYYKVGETIINHQTIDNSPGQAMDALAGLTWSFNGWRLGAGVAFGLLEESHTSFDLERGAGDTQLLFNFAYQLKSKKPSS